MTSDGENPPHNGSGLNIAQLIKTVKSLAAEAELGALYINAQEAIPLQVTVNKMGYPHPQLPILMQTDNLTIQGVITNNIQHRCTKTMDMRFHWL